MRTRSRIALGGLVAGVTLTSLVVTVPSAACACKVYVTSGEPSGTGSVIDNVTGLMWERPATYPAQTFANATTYCANLVLDGTNSMAATDPHAGSRPSVDGPVASGFVQMNRAPSTISRIAVVIAEKL